MTVQVLTVVLQVLICVFFPADIKTKFRSGAQIKQVNLAVKLFAVGTNRTLTRKKLSIIIRLE